MMKRSMVLITIGLCLSIFGSGTSGQDARVQNRQLQMRSLNGYVKDSEEPYPVLAHIVVHLYVDGKLQASDETDKYGHYTFTNVPNGLVTVKVEMAKYELNPTVRPCNKNHDEMLEVMFLTDPYKKYNATQINPDGIAKQMALSVRASYLEDDPLKNKEAWKLEWNVLKTKNISPEACVLIARRLMTIDGPVVAIPALEAYSGVDLNKVKTLDALFKKAVINVDQLPVPGAANTQDIDNRIIADVVLYHIKDRDRPLADRTSLANGFLKGWASQNTADIVRKSLVEKPIKGINIAP